VLAEDVAPERVGTVERLLVDTTGETVTAREGRVSTECGEWERRGRTRSGTEKRGRVSEQSTTEEEDRAHHDAEILITSRNPERPLRTAIEVVVDFLLPLSQRNLNLPPREALPTRHRHVSLDLLTGQTTTVDGGVVIGDVGDVKTLELLFEGASGCVPFKGEEGRGGVVGAFVGRDDHGETVPDTVGGGVVCRRRKGKDDEEKVRKVASSREKGEGRTAEHDTGHHHEVRRHLAASAMRRSDGLSRRNRSARRFRTGDLVLGDVKRRAVPDLLVGPSCGFLRLLGDLDAILELVEIGKRLSGLDAVQAKLAVPPCGLLVALFPSTGVVS
jgi:hypothetical protein